MIDLITGHQGIPHISAEQISTLHRSLMGTNGDNKVVRMKDGGVTSVGLTVSIDTGYWRVHGYDMQIQEAEAVIFDPTEAGYQRIDDLFVEILQDISSGVQRSELVIVQGEPSAIIATAPAPPTEAASEYDLLVECVPVCSVLVIEGAMTMTDLTIPFKASSGDSESFAPEFDPALSYNIGDVVEHEGTLYKFIANHTGAWDDADVEETTVAALIAGKADIPVPINQGGTEATTADQARGHLGAASNTEFHYAYNMIRNSSSDAYSTTKSYKAGDYCIHGNLLYKCTSACTPGSWEVNRSHFAIDTIANALTSVNNELNDLFVVENITMPSMNIAGSSYVGVQKSIAKSGYTPIAVAGAYSGSGYAVLVQADFITSTEIGFITLRNLSTATLNVTGATLRILYRKN